MASKLLLMCMLSVLSFVFLAFITSAFFYVDLFKQIPLSSLFARRSSMRCREIRNGNLLQGPINRRTRAKTLLKQFRQFSAA
jgi:hypothetical protein